MNDRRNTRNGFYVTQPKQRSARYVTHRGDTQRHAPRPEPGHRRRHLVAAAIVLGGLCATNTAFAQAAGNAYGYPAQPAANDPWVQAPAQPAPPHTAPAQGVPVRPAPAQAAPAQVAPAQRGGHAAPAYPSQGAYPGYGYGYGGTAYGTPAYSSPATVAADRADEVAGSDEEPSGVAFDLAVGTNVPLSLGGQATLEIPGRVLAQLDVGWMPEAYGSLISGVMSGVGNVSRTHSAVVESTLQSAVVVRASAGWRPFSSAGFELFGGYTYVGLSGQTTPADLADLAGQEISDEIDSDELDQDVNLSSRLHNFHVALGWRWLAFDEHLVIRANLGYTQTVASSSEVETPETPAIGQSATPRVDRELDSLYTKYVKLPTVGLSAGYRF